LPVLFLVTSTKLVAEVALMALVGRWLLGLMAGAGRECNPFYQVLDILVRPFLRAARWLAPREVLDRHLPMVAMLLLSFLWLAALAGKVRLCLALGMAACR
jgi:hypothetical protein